MYDVRVYSTGTAFDLCVDCVVSKCIFICLTIGWFRTIFILFTSFTMCVPNIIYLFVNRIHPSSCMLCIVELKNRRWKTRIVALHTQMHEIADGADDDLWINFLEWLAIASYSHCTWMPMHGSLFHFTAIIFINHKTRNTFTYIPHDHTAHT